MAATVDERQAGRPPVQAAFAAFWLVRASLAIGGRAGDVLLAASGVAVIGMFAYAITVTADTAPRPPGPQARRIERSMTVATVIELVAAFVLPVIVVAAGHSDWVLPSWRAKPTSPSTARNT